MSKVYSVTPGDFETYSFREAVEALEEQGYGHIEVYDEMNYCEREIHFTDIRG